MTPRGWLAGIGFVLSAGVLAACADDAEGHLGVSVQALEPGSWRSVAPMALPRAYHRSSRLADGRVMVTGEWKSEIIHASAEIYDPLVDAWSAIPDMLQPRIQHVMETTGDGRVLVAGGQRPATEAFGEATNAAELFDPTTNAWTSLPPMTARRRYGSSTVLEDGRILVVGGQEELFLTTKGAEIFDPSTGTWTLVAEMSRPRSYHTATRLADGRVLVAGGSASWNADGAVESTEIFDPSTGAWTAAAPMQEARANHVATALRDGRVIVSGGLDPQYSSLASAEIYDRRLDEWSTAPPMSGPRHAHYGTRLMNGDLLVVGGRQLSFGNIEAFVMRSDAEVFDTAAGLWLPAGDMQSARGMGAIELLVDGKVVVTGGVDTLDDAVDHVDVFTPRAGTPCTGPDACPSGACVDGICCDRPCTAACEVCSAEAGAVKPGTCTELDVSASGACLRSCRSVEDCPAPLTCDLSGHCAPAPPRADDKSGCAFVTSPPSRAGDLLLVLLVSTVLAARSRERGSTRHARAKRDRAAAETEVVET